MSEKILEALMQLFAIVASVRGSSDMSERRKVVYTFLSEQLNKELANKYISRFDEYYRNNIQQAQRSENHYKVISRISSKATRIAIEIHQERRNTHIPRRFYPRLREERIHSSA